MITIRILTLFYRNYKLFFMDDETLIDLTYIKIAPNRVKVLNAFQDEDLLRPFQIANKTNLHPNTVSKQLKDLREHDLVCVINPEYHVPRLYRLTSKGKKILNLLDDS